MSVSSSLQAHLLLPSQVLGSPQKLRTFYLTPYKKLIQNGSQNSENLNVRAKTIKLLDEKIGQKHHGVRLGYDQNAATKEKGDELDFIKI